MRCRVCFSVIILLAFWKIGFNQNSATYLEKASTLIGNKQYASANQLLESAIHKAGMQPELVCMQVENALQNYSYHKNYISFYLTDAIGTGNAKNQKQPINVSFLRYPDRLLERITDQNPNYGEAYKLLGDYYYLKIRNPIDSTLIDKEALKKIEENVLENYSKAFELGYNDPLMNRWLGNYFKDHNQLNSAKKYYQKNVDSNYDDIMTFYYLADIFYKEKQYSQSYSYILKVLPNISDLRMSIRYNALKIGALSMFYLGEIERFKKYIQDCMQIFPDQQEPYLALLKYYDEKKDVDKMQEIILKMLTQNPYDLPGYNFFKSFVVKFDRYLFSEQLFENLMLNYENSDQVMGNVYWYRGDIYFNQGMIEEAKNSWEISRSYFKKYLPEDDPLLKKIGNVNQKTFNN